MQNKLEITETLIDTLKNLTDMLKKQRECIQRILKLLEKK